MNSSNHIGSRGAHKLEGGVRSMSKYLASWGADAPFANLLDTSLANNIGETVSVECVYVKSSYLS